MNINLDTCGKFGLKALVEGVKPEEVHRISKHPALYGYYIMDEPLHNFPALAKIYNDYLEADPTKPGFINLISLGGDLSQQLHEDCQAEYPQLRLLPVLVG